MELIVDFGGYSFGICLVRDWAGLGRRVSQSLDRRHFRFAVTETDKAVGLNVHILGDISYFIR